MASRTTACCPHAGGPARSLLRIVDRRGGPRAIGVEDDPWHVRPKPPTGHKASRHRGDRQQPGHTRKNHPADTLTVGAFARPMTRRST